MHAGGNVVLHHGGLISFGRNNMGFDGLEVNFSVAPGVKLLSCPVKLSAGSGLSPVRLSAGQCGRLHRISRSMQFVLVSMDILSP